MLKGHWQQHCFIISGIIPFTPSVHLFSWRGPAYCQVLIIHQELDAGFVNVVWFNPSHKPVKPRQNLNFELELKEGAVQMQLEEFPSGLVLKTTCESLLKVWLLSPHVLGKFWDEKRVQPPAPKCPTCQPRVYPQFFWQPSQALLEPYSFKFMCPVTSVKKAHFVSSLGLFKPFGLFKTRHTPPTYRM